VDGLDEDACVLGFRDAAGANLRAADHPVLLMVEVGAVSCLVVADSGVSLACKGTPEPGDTSEYREARLTKLSAKLSLFSRFHREEMDFLLSMEG
jgi:hypothetical protein